MHLSTLLVGDALLVAVVIGHTDSLHAELGFECAWCVIDTSVENTTVVA